MIRGSRVVGTAILAALTAAAAPARAVIVEVDANPPGEIGRAVTFSARATGTGSITYSWNFGDGTVTEASAESSASHVYAAPGHYAVIVIARDETGPRSASFLQTIHRPTTAASPTASSTIVHDAPRHRVCNVNADNDSVSCIDTQLLERTFEAPVGAHPRTLAIAADGSIWVANQDDGTLTVLEPDGRSRRTIELGAAAAPFGVVTDPARDRVFVTLQGPGEVVTFDAASGGELARGKAGNLPAGIAVSADGGRVFVTTFISPQDRGEVHELDGTTLANVRVLTLALDPGPDGEGGSRGVPNYLRQVVISPDGISAIVPSKKDNVLRGPVRDGLALTFETSVRTIVSRLDLTNNVELAEQRLDFNNRALGLAAAYSPLGDYFFVVMLGSGGISMVDTYNGNTVGGLLKVAIAPDGVALDGAGRLFMHAFLSRKVVVIDASAALAGVAFDLPMVAEIATIGTEKLAPAVLSGKKIFYDASDPRMTQHGYISCASCHLDGFEDGRVWDFTDRGEGLRNTTSLLGKRGIGQGRLHWSANFDEVQDFEHDIRNAFNGTGFMSDADFMTGTRNTTLGDPKAGVSRELDDLSEYVTSLDRVRPSPFRAPDGGLTADGRAGLAIFVRAGCAECHSGPDLTDSSTGMLHDVGTLRPTSGKRLNGPLEGIDTPTLRGIWATAPYLHDGSAATLLEVVSGRNLDDRHGRTSALSASEKDALVSYLLQIDNSDDKPSPGAGGCGCRMTESPRRSVGGFVALLLGFGWARARRGRTASRAMATARARAATRPSTVST
jgi:MYXO-CTERM domain-containing protein